MSIESLSFDTRPSPFFLVSICLTLFQRLPTHWTYRQPANKLAFNSSHQQAIVASQSP
uniref:Uncharacterized protein n=1 Tax=Picea glauca TaxID=3330 RepID=A0A101LY46_PICGL|nr:hypothetical protein ABT39_MTgene5690 [Picea glauca]